MDKRIQRDWEDEFFDFIWGTKPTMNANSNQNRVINEHFSTGINRVGPAQTWLGKSIDENMDDVRKFLDMTEIDEFRTVRNKPWNINEFNCTNYICNSRIKRVHTWKKVVSEASMDDVLKYLESNENDNTLDEITSTLNENETDVNNNPEVEIETEIKTEILINGTEEITMTTTNECSYDKIADKTTNKTSDETKRDDDTNENITGIDENENRVDENELKTSEADVTKSNANHVRVSDSSKDAPEIIRIYLVNVEGDNMHLSHTWGAKNPVQGSTKEVIDITEGVFHIKFFHQNPETPGDAHVLSVVLPEDKLFNLKPKQRSRYFDLLNRNGFVPDSETGMPAILNDLENRARKSKPGCFGFFRKLFLRSKSKVHNLETAECNDEITRRFLQRFIPGRTDDRKEMAPKPILKFKEKPWVNRQKKKSKF